MRTVEEHLDIVLALAKPLEPLDHTLADAAGCVLAEDISAAWPLPQFDNASMDGYAVLCSDLTEASAEARVTLTVIDDVPAGSSATHEVTPGTAIRIMTGAPMPAGADSVVTVEWTDAGTETVSIDRPVDEGAHIRRRGEEVEAGDVVLHAGTPLGARQIALLAAVGRGRALVHPRPRVVILTTGSELMEPGVELTPGKITDSNGIMLSVAAEEAGADPFRVGPVQDDEELLMRTLEDQLVRADLIVTSGGVSAGAFDTVKSVLSKIGTVEFSKVAMQPGMPQGAGTLGDDLIPIFTLPGNPVSSYVSFEVFVRPIIRLMAGHREIFRPVVRAILKEEVTSPAGRRSFARGRLSVEAGKYVISPVGTGQASHLIAGLSEADALIVIGEDDTLLEPGTTVSVLRLNAEH